MANTPQQVAIQLPSNLETNCSVVNPRPQVIYMEAATPVVNQKIPYDKRINKKIMLTLSTIQLFAAGIVIFIQIETMSKQVWCGISFGISGVFGIVASMYPGFGTIVTLMVFNIIAAVLCFPLFITSFFLVSVISLIQMLISLAQAATAIASSAMACKALDCCCCRPSRQDGVVYHANNGGREANVLTSLPPDISQQQPGYVTIPIRQIPIASAPQLVEDPPPAYDTVTKYEHSEAFESVENNCE